MLYAVIENLSILIKTHFGVFFVYFMLTRVDCYVAKAQPMLLHRDKPPNGVENASKACF